MNLEYKNIPFEVKADDLRDGEFRGHGSVFGNEDLQGDIVAPGAFKATLKEHESKGTMPQMFWMHDPTQVPGKWLGFSEDQKGLASHGQLLPTTLGQDMHILLQAKAVRGLSIGFQILEADFDKSGVRIIKAVALWEVSLVSLAANPLAEVESAKTARLSGICEYVPTMRQFEHDLRERLGYSRRVATEVTSKVFGGNTPQWDTDDEDMKALTRALHRPWERQSADSLFQE